MNRDIADIEGCSVGLFNPLLLGYNLNAMYFVVVKFLVNCNQVSIHFFLSLLQCGYHFEK